MKWFQGNIAEAVNLSKQRNSVFVVYVFGNDEMSQKLSRFIEDDKVRTKLESEQFVAIKIDSGSEAYMQFAQIYQLVPLPSLFFIGKNGAPIQVVTGVIASSDELEQKINTVLETVGIKEIVQPSKLDDQASTSSMANASAGASASQQFIAGEQTNSTSNTEIVCEGGVCYRRPKDNEPESKPSTTSSNVDSNIFVMPSAANSQADSASNLPAAQTSTSAPIVSPEPAVESASDIAERVEKAKKLIEEKRKQREEEEKRLEREREIRRRKEGQEMLNFKQQQRDQELQEMKDKIRREKLEEQAARQRILEKIASDRAEQAKKFAPATEKPTPPSPSQPGAAESAAAQSAPVPNSSEFSRIQFRRPEGETSTHTFKSSEKFQVVRDHVRNTILLNAGIREFSLATTFPRREFPTTDDSKSLVELGLCPSAVLLVIASQRAGSGPAAIVARSGGFVNVFNTLFWGLLSPFFAAFGYVRSWFAGGRPGTAPSSGTQKRANEESMADNDAAKRRNIDRLLNRNFVDDAPSTSKANETKSEGAYRRVGGSNIHRLRENKDSDDENNTWNGNSTQQQ